LVPVSGRGVAEKGGGMKDPTQGDLLRDAGIERVTRSNSEWMEAALEAVAALRSGLELKGEDIRFHVLRALPPPTHHNAWGALIRTAKGRGILRYTGHHAKMDDPRSHSRMTPVYRTT
jgi:hypothetical protein